MGSKHSKPENKKRVWRKEDKEVKKNEKVIRKTDKKLKRKHPKLRKFFMIVLILFVVLVVAGIAGIVAIFKTDKWTITKEELLSDAGATVVNQDGTVEIARLTGDEINKKVNIDEMGKIPEAFISIEDERFYEHNGVDTKRTAHAILEYILHHGNSKFGGSTITQQLVKITMKDDDKSGFAGIQRKIREWSRARQVENAY